MFFKVPAVRKKPEPEEKVPIAVPKKEAAPPAKGTLHYCYKNHKLFLDAFIFFLYILNVFVICFEYVLCTCQSLVCVSLFHVFLFFVFFNNSKILKHFPNKWITKKKYCIFKVPEVPKKVVAEDKMPTAVEKRKEPSPPKGRVYILGKGNIKNHFSRTAIYIAK